MNGVSQKSCPPLRILVPSDQVGAIIGKKGATVKNITTQNKARVDVHGKENSGLSEKTISIYGQPSNCSNALKEILQILREDSSALNKGPVTLKMLADDRYCGRLIGKEGKFIKKVMDSTNTKITVSNMQDVMSIYPDRILTIKGSLDSMVSAQGLISSKLNECIEKDSANVNMLMTHNGSYQERRPFGNNNNQTESCQITVPNHIVGSIIGCGGSIIKQIMLDSSAKVTVEPKQEKEDRTVVISGTGDACWKASYFIFEKVKGEGMIGSGDRLKTGVKIPKSAVGRVIGKNGKNVKEIQRMTGATIHLPEVQEEEEVLVEVFGNFMATQGAHNRIRALVSQPEVPAGKNPKF